MHAFVKIFVVVDPTSPISRDWVCWCPYSISYCIVHASTKQIWHYHTPMAALIQQNSLSAMTVPIHILQLSCAWQNLELGSMDPRIHNFHRNHISNTGSRNVSTNPDPKHSLVSWCASSSYYPRPSSFPLLALYQTRPYYCVCPAASLPIHVPYPTRKDDQK